MSTAVPITVAIPTFQREHSLPMLLEEVARQAAELQNPVDLVVIDNDPARSAESVVRPFVERHGYRYVTESTPGIAAVRDTAVLSAGDSRLLVFIDDDEMPLPRWLQNIVGYWESSQCAAVAGPQDFILPEDIPDPWVVASGVFEGVHHQTGTKRRGASSANLLLDLDFLRENDLRFERELGLRGGEDTMLTHKITAAGGVIEWCDEAVVVERVPPERISRAWLRRRSFRSGASWGRAELAASTGWSSQLTTRAIIALRGAALIGISGLAAVHGAVHKDQRVTAKNLRTIYSLAGSMSSVVGARQIEDYSRS